jgi:hypothetical protein
MITYTPDEISSYDSAFRGGIVKHTSDYLANMERKSPGLVKKDAIADGFRKIGEQIAEKFIHHAGPIVFGESKLDAEELTKIERERTLVSSFRDQLGFLDKTKLEQLLHQLLIDDKNRAAINSALQSEFINFTNTMIDIKAFRAHRMSENGFELLEPSEIKEDQFGQIGFAVFFKEPIELTWQKLHDAFSSGKKDLTKTNLQIGTISDVLGKVEDAPIPTAEPVFAATHQGMTIVQSPLAIYYTQKAEESQAAMNQDTQTPLLKLFAHTLQKFFNAEIGIEETAKFMIYLQNVGNSLREEIPEQYSQWFEAYKKANPLGEREE